MSLSPSAAYTINIVARWRGNDTHARGSRCLFSRLRVCVCILRALVVNSLSLFLPLTYPSPTIMYSIRDFVFDKWNRSQLVCTTSVEPVYAALSSLARLDFLEVMGFPFLLFILRIFCFFVFHARGEMARWFDTSCMTGWALSGICNLKELGRK